MAEKYGKEQSTSAVGNQPTSGAAGKEQPPPGSDGDEQHEHLDSQARRFEEAAFANMTGGIGFAGPSEFGGDAVGGDKTTYNYYFSSRETRAKVVTWAVREEVLDNLAAVYVRSNAYDRARQILTDQRVLLLYGQAHWGKWVTALCLLRELQASEVRMLDHDKDVRRLDPADLQRGCGYVIDTLAPKQARQLTDFQLGLLSDSLRSSQGYLAVTVDSRTVRRREFPEDYLVICEDCPDPAEVLRAHLSSLLDDSRSEQRDELLGHPKVQEFLQTEPLPHEVARLAEFLAAANGELNVEDAITRFDEHRVRKEIEEWFQSHKDRGDRAFMLALAVFNGAAYQDVLGSAERLEELFQEIEEPEGLDGRPGRVIFSTTKSERLAEARARPVETEDLTTLGAIPVEAVEFTNPRYARVVLDTVWQEHGAARFPVLTWLQELAEDRSPWIRVCAAMAIGRLSTYDFRHIHDEILADWSRSKISWVRQSVAWMLAIPAWDNALAPVVRALLRDWSDPDSNRWRDPDSSRCRKLTAAAAYGTKVGVLFPDAALGGLKRIATYSDRDDELISRVVSYSVANLFEAGYEQLVLDALLAWTAQDDESLDRSKQAVLAKNGLECFLRITKANPPPEGEGWPPLLALMQDDPSWVERIITLWRRALRTRPLVKDSPDGTQRTDGDPATLPPRTRLLVKDPLKVLRDWVRQADNDSRLVELLWPIVDSLADGGRDERRLMFNLQRWAEHPKKPSRGAAALLEKLHQRGQQHGGQQQLQ
ncbi:MAG: hypothetical protein ACRDZ4_17620 [Egibacteraceae bacterium]